MFLYVLHPIEMFNCLLNERHNLYLLDYNDLVRKLGIEGKKVAITKKRKINARAIWYDNMNADIVPRDKDLI